MSRRFVRSVAIVLSLFCWLPGAAIALEDQAAAFQEFLENAIRPRATEFLSEAQYRRIAAQIDLLSDLPGLEERRPDDSARQAEFSDPRKYFRLKRMREDAQLAGALLTKHASMLDRVEETFHVPREIVLAVWGKESSFGKAELSHSALDVVATRAFLGSRKEFFQAELLDLLRLGAEDGIDVSALSSSWAGAMGQPQFMPSSFRKYARDFDGDGRRDIWSSVPDTLASIANFLSMHGWNRHYGWGRQIDLPATLSCAEEGPDQPRLIDAWTKLGILDADGQPLAFQHRTLLNLVLPAGRFGPTFLVTPNFYVLKDYNTSDVYALYIGMMADMMAAGPNPKLRWDEFEPISRAMVFGIQRSLVQQGLDVGAMDGLIGYKTRRSIGRWQTSNGLPAICYADERFRLSFSERMSDEAAPDKIAPDHPSPGTKEYDEELSAPDRLKELIERLP